MVNDGADRRQRDGDDHGLRQRLPERFRQRRRWSTTTFRTLSLTLAQTTVSEAAGADATTGTVSIASPASQPITIVLASSDTTAATVPASVVIDAGQESASFPIAAVNNGLDVGNQTAVITASVETYAGVVVTQGSAEASLLLLNANGPALSLSFADVHRG